MKVFLFKVTSTEDSVELRTIFEQISNTVNLRDRIKVINKSELRAEFIEERNGLWLIDFIKIRTDHGPGRVGRDNAVQGFYFEVDEGFGEETSALYDPATGYFIAEYNHFGVRPAAMADYFSMFDREANNLYTFEPKYDPDIERKLLNQTLTRKLAFSIDISKMNQADRDRGVALSDAIRYGRETGADKLKIEISVSGDRSRTLTQLAKDGITNLQTLLGQNSEAITKIEVAGKEDRDSITEVLDLIGHRLSKQFNDLQVGDDLRYPREERWNALIRAKNGWNQVINP